MPIYEFRCADGHITERIWSINYWEDIKRLYKGLVVCGAELGNTNGLCIKNAERIWSVPANIQIGKPTIVFVNPQTGVSQVATSQYDPPPPGFITQELKGPIERSKFENQQAEIAKMDDMIFNEDIRQKREDFRNQHIKLIDEHLREDAQSSDNPELTVKLMKAAKDRIRKKDPLAKKRKTEFRLDVNHIDNSNLK